MIKISFVIPVYNAKSTIRRTIESCLRQKCLNLDVEVLAVDDGSTDGSSRELDSLAAEFPELKVIHKENAGVSSARNTGIDAAKGEYMMFVDADDYLSDNAIAGLVLEMASRGIQLLAHGAIVESPDSPVSYTACPQPEVISTTVSGLEYIRENEGPYKKGQVSGAWGFIISRDIILRSRIRFIEGLPFGEDSLFFLYLLPHVQTIATTDRKFYHYVQCPTSAMHRPHSLRKVTGASLIRCIHNRRLTTTPEISSDSELCDIITARMIPIAFSRVFMRMFREKTSLAEFRRIRKQYSSEGFWPLPALPATHSPYTGRKALIYNLLRLRVVFPILLVLNKLR